MQTVAFECVGVNMKSPWEHKVSGGFSSLAFRTVSSTHCGDGAPAPLEFHFASRFKAWISVEAAAFALTNRPRYAKIRIY
jgi:hypothetical protein